MSADMSAGSRSSPPRTDRIAEARRAAERRLPSEEFEAYVRAPISDAERENALALIDWFTSRYPTPAERLAYARRAADRWRAARPPEPWQRRAPRLRRGVRPSW